VAGEVGGALNIVLRACERMVEDELLGDRRPRRTSSRSSSSAAGHQVSTVSWLLWRVAERGDGPVG
jgi:hypothetical protein